MTLIINLSVQSGGDSGTPNPIVAKAIKDALQTGAIVVAAAGNCGPNEGTMSRYALVEGVISIGSANWTGTSLSEFSSRGVSGSPDSGPTLVAPGEDLIGKWLPKPKSPEQIERDERHINYATLRRQTGHDHSGRDLDRIRARYTVMSGTSQACAYVSGLIGRFISLRKAQGQTHDRPQVLEFFRRAARKINGTGDHEQGLGFVSIETIEEYLRTVQPTDDFWGNRAVGVDSAWRNAKGEGVVLALLDTGKPDQAKVVDAKDFTNSLTGVQDVNGHATHICGIIFG